MQNVEVI